MDQHHQQSYLNAQVLRCTTIKFDKFIFHKQTLSIGFEFSKLPEFAGLLGYCICYIVHFPCGSDIAALHAIELNLS